MESERDFKDLFTGMNFNSTLNLGATVDERNEKLADLLDGVAKMKLGDFKDNSIDPFGDAYEYLMKMYATFAGKSGGEFFTPQEASKLLALITTWGKHKVNKVYDPACGSGSLLLKFAKVLGKDKVRQGFFGQEINLTTYNLCRINMFLHNINYDKFDIQLGDTLVHPQHRQLEPFDAIVSNPPYSIEWEGSKNPLLINDDRFSGPGVLAPDKTADLAFTLHMLASLSESGTAAIVEFPGVLYRGGKEKSIRQWLIENNRIDTIIQLPANLFFGVGIATCIIVLRKGMRPDNKVLFIDASREFVKSGNKNRLTTENQDHIFNVFAERKEEQYFSCLVPNSDILANDANLSVSSYVEQEDTREVIDIKAVNAKLTELIAEGEELNRKIDAIVKELGE